MYIICGIQVQPPSWTASNKTECEWVCGCRWINRALHRKQCTAQLHENDFDTSTIRMIAALEHTWVCEPNTYYIMCICKDSFQDSCISLFNMCIPRILLAFVWTAVLCFINCVAKAWCKNYTAMLFYVLCMSSIFQHEIWPCCQRERMIENEWYFPHFFEGAENHNPHSSRRTIMTIVYTI